MSTLFTALRRKEERAFAYNRQGGEGPFTCHQLQLLAGVPFRVQLGVAAVPNLADEAGRQGHEVTADEDAGAALQGHGLRLLLHCGHRPDLVRGVPRLRQDRDGAGERPSLPPRPGSDALRARPPFSLPAPLVLTPVATTRGSERTEEGRGGLLAPPDLETSWEGLGGSREVSPRQRPADEAGMSGRCKEARPMV